MAKLDCHTDPSPSVTLDPDHLTITFHAHPVHVAMDIPEAARVSAELLARLEQARGVNGAPTEVSEA